MKLDHIYLFLKPSVIVSKRFPFDDLMSIKTESPLISLDIVISTTFLSPCRNLEIPLREFFKDSLIGSHFKQYTEAAFPLAWNCI